ncbi:hypothetical protein [Mucilaginibacter hurinus]|nr:hypothetical protein [Mucilaginibacter hurinus]
MKKRRMLIALLAAASLSACKKDGLKKGSPIDSAPKKTNAITCSPATFSSIATTYNTHFTRGNTTTSQWTGADATYSIPLGGGKILWMFGDTFVGYVNPPDATHPHRWRPSSSMNPNTFMIQNTSVTPNTWITVVGMGVDPVSWMWWPPAKTGNEYLSGTAKTWYWPGDATISGDNLYIYFTKFQGIAGGGYSTIGTDLFTFSVSGLNALTATVSNINSTKTSVFTMPLSATKETIFGTSLMEDGTNNYIYISDKIDYSPYGLWHAAKAYRVPSSNINGTKAYFTGYGPAPTYSPVYGSSTFSGSGNTTGIMKKLAGGVLSDLLLSPQFSVIKIGSKYRLITQEDMGKKIYSYEAASPVGPWECETLIHTISDPNTNVTYNAFLHPHIKNGATTYLLSYNLNGNTFADVYNNVDTYRPKFIWVNIP